MVALGSWTWASAFAAVSLASGPSTLDAPSESAPEPAAGSVTQPRVDWSAPLGCPTKAWFLFKIEGLVGSLETPTPLSIDGVVAVAPTGYRLDLRIELDGAVERRDLQSDDCVLLTSAAALLVAISVDAVATSESVTRTEGAAPPQPSPVGAPADVPEPGAWSDEEAPSTIPQPREPQRKLGPDGQAPSRARTSAWRHGAELMAGGGLGLGLAADITGGVEGWVGWRFGPVRVRAGGYHWFSRPRALTTTAGIRAALSGGSLRGCYALVRRRLEIPLCLGPDLAALHGAGDGEGVSSQPASDLWVALAASGGIEVQVSGRFRVHARTEASVAARQPAFHLRSGDDAVEVFRSPLAALRIVLGPSVVF